MKLNNKIIYGAIIVFLALSIIIAFKTETVPDEDYALLLKSGMNLENAKIFSMLIFIAFPILIYFISVYLLGINEFYSFGAVLIFIFATINIQTVFSFSPVLAFLLGKEYEIIDSFKMSGVLLPLSVLGLLLWFGQLRRGGEPPKLADIITGVLAILGLIALFFAPGIGIVLIVFSAAKGIGLFENMEWKNKAIIIVFALFAFQERYAGDGVTALAGAIFIAIIAYIFVSIHSINNKEACALVLFFIVYEIFMAINTVGTAETVQSNEITVFMAAKKINGSFGVFANENAFIYYAGKNASVLKPSALLKTNATIPDFMVVSNTVLDKVYAQNPIFFAYKSIWKDENQEIAIFLNSRYVLYMDVKGEEIMIKDAELIDKQTGERRSVMFTKIKKLLNSSFRNADNRMICMDGIEESTLYSLLFHSNLIFEQNGTKIIGMG